MKITISPDGSVELDVTNGEGQVALDLIRSIQAGANQPAPTPPSDVPDPDALTEMQKDTYVALLGHNHGIHYRAVARTLGVNPPTANTRCTALVNLGFAERVRSGVYRLVGE